LTFFKGFDAVMNPFDYKSFITHYIGIPIYIFGYIGYKRTYSFHPSCAHDWWAVIRRTKMVKFDEMDLSTGSREFADLEGEEEDEGYSGMNWKQKAIYNLKNW
jgi:amino acid transporter